MTAKKFSSALVVSLGLTLPLMLAPTMVWAYGNLQENYQEVSYDDLINELNSEHSSAMDLDNKKKSAPLRQARLGVGFVHSFTQLHIHNESSGRSQSGLQIAGSMNLDTPNLFAEGVFRNFSGSTIASESLHVQQLDARIGFRNDLTAPWKYTLLTGFTARLLQAKNTAKDYSVSELTPSFTAGFGAQAEIHKNVHLGFEVTGRTSLFGNNTEKNSADIAVRLDTAL